MRQSVRALQQSMARYFKITLDWDGTLTHDDTMFMMAKIVAQRDLRTGQNTEPETAWKKFTDAYMVDHDAHKARAMPTIVSERRNPLMECVWLQSFRVVGERSMARANDAGYFKGVIRQDIQRAVAEAVGCGAVKLRRDWQRLFVESATARAGLPLPPNAHIYEIEILSVNWSETMIRETLLHNVQLLSNIDEIQRKNLSTLVEHMVITANDLVGLETAPGSTGSLIRPNKLCVHTTLDKKTLYSRSLDQVHVYVGDSLTDLDCLLIADIGICIRDDPLSSTQQELYEALNRTRVFVKHVTDLKQVDETVNGQPAQAKFWYAKDFLELSSFLSRITVLRA